MGLIRAVCLLCFDMVVMKCIDGSPQWLWKEQALVCNSAGSKTHCHHCPGAERVLTASGCASFSVVLNTGTGTCSSISQHAVEAIHI